MSTHLAVSVSEERLYTTAGGLQRFTERVQQAHAAYDAVIATNGDAAEAGDNSVWHDNFAYEENQRQMHQLARRIRDLRAAAERLTVIAPSPRPTRVGIGCAVTVEDQDGREERIVVGGYEDSDAAHHRVSYTAPLARALMGAEAGDTLTVALGRNTRELTILDIACALPEEL